jgi:uncharacterized protein YciI
MKVTRDAREMLAEGKSLEQAGKLPEAAALYRDVIDDDAGNHVAVARLLVMYRKLKEYGKELAVIKDALTALEQRDKMRREKWIREHPGAAGAGKAIFKKLGGAVPSAFEADPVVMGLLKRKTFVEKRLEGKKTKKGAVVRRIATKSPAARKKGPATPGKVQERKQKEQERKQKEQERREKAAAARRIAEEQRKRRLQERKRKEQERKQKEEERKQKEEDRKRKEEERKKKEQDRKTAKLAAEKAKAERIPSLFVISLRYLVSLEEIDAVMSRHIAFLNKHYKQGDFLVSGRQVPRTGGIIIAVGKDRAAVERIMRQDPFVKGKLASLDIVEFSASQAARGFKIG